MVYLQKLNLFTLSKFFLACLIISINIREPFFHTREIFFVLFMITSFKYANFKQIYKPILLFFIWSTTSLLNYLIPGSNIQLSIATIIASIYLLLLCFSTKKYSETIIKSYILSSIVVGLIVFSLWLICFLFPDLFSILKTISMDVKESHNLVTFYVDKRNFFGYLLITANYRTSVCMIGALTYYLLKQLYHKKNYSIPILFLATALFFTGTRANMLVSICLPLFYITFSFFKKKHYFSALFLAMAITVTILTFSYLFLTDSTSHSTKIKLLDRVSYYNVFTTDIIRTLFYGWGEGSTFYSLGRGRMVDLTEVSYLVNIRRFGLLATFVIFIIIWLDELIKFIISKKNNSILKLFYFIAIFSYICVACTNPFLVDSVGFCALLFFQTLLRYYSTSFSIENSS